jgi:hypothetical protein
MSRNGFRNIRAAIKSQRAFHAHWEKKQREKLRAKYGIEKENTVEPKGTGETRR